ncbi:neutral zinc metallopeptidase [Thiothrix subterranea]|uniref:neutral zinc metallopeptidase n=1 Tax=Thiothrix subterranea TaxID=2735563 RepID=UPI00280BB056|nr:neutral zinc metallopeptidase [Thiothrix subterranea]
MRWKTGRQSSNVEDRRGGRSGGGGGGMKIGLLGTIAAVLIGWYMGFNPIQVLGLVGEARYNFRRFWRRQFHPNGGNGCTTR